MCDYSLHSVASRAANLDDKLVVTDFAKTITRGFAAGENPMSPSACSLAPSWRSRTTSNTTAL